MTHHHDRRDLPDVAPSRSRPAPQPSNELADCIKTTSALVAGVVLITEVHFSLDDLTVFFGIVAAAASALRLRRRP